ncbi:hypothetical protein AB0D94_20270 [Streptomyces sp. NPDC048255]|uniref:hypothetical protein n=1 Tax=Streptomyces TaxID=1883 RepID=UPI0033FE81BE
MDARAATAAGGAALLGLLLSGCGAGAARVDGARDAGRAFGRALALRDYAAACALLAPDTRAQVEADEKRACRPALEAQELTPPGKVRTVEVYGRQALVRAEGQTLFLSQFAGGWLVVAAGCTPRSDGPHRCVVKGG